MYRHVRVLSLHSFRHSFCFHAIDGVKFPFPYHLTPISVAFNKIYFMLHFHFLLSFLVCLAEASDLAYFPSHFPFIYDTLLISEMRWNFMQTFRIHRVYLWLWHPLIVTKKPSSCLLWASVHSFFLSRGETEESKSEKEKKSIRFYWRCREGEMNECSSPLSRQWNNKEL